MAYALCQNRHNVGVTTMFTMRDKEIAIPVEEALEIVLNTVSPLAWEEVPIIEAADRVLYEDIVSNTSIPFSDDSAMDGYAIIADDTHGASRKNPVRLRIVGEMQAGGPGIGRGVSKGTAIRIMTGALMPEGADSVIKLEDTEEEAGCVKIFREVVRHENRRSAGESITKGERVLRKGDRLKSADVGILASLDYGVVKAYRRPTVSIISTGDEIAEIGEDIQTGQIRNVSAHTLYSEAKKYSALPQYLGIAKDRLNDTKEVLLRALESDVVISTGGVSKGKYDLVKKAYADLGIEILFERVRLKPGAPCVFGRKGNKLLFGLPGYPVPTLIAFIRFVRPALLKLMGAQKIRKPIVNAFLEKDIDSSRIHHLLRGYFTIRDNEFYVTTAGNQKPSVLRSMSAANCLISVPEDVVKVRAGERVAIELIYHDEIQ